MTDTLRHQALGALAVLRHTSQDKATILAAYVDALEAQSQIARDRAAQLQGRGWRFVRNHASTPMLRLRHSRSFYEVNLWPNGDAEFRLLRVRHRHRICAQDADGFEAYLTTIDHGEQQALRWAKWSLVGAVAIFVATIVLRTGYDAR